MILCIWKSTVEGNEVSVVKCESIAGIAYAGPRLDEEV